MNGWLFALILWLTLDVGFLLGCWWASARTPVFHVMVTNPDTTSE